MRTIFIHFTLNLIDKIHIFYEQNTPFVVFCPAQLKHISFGSISIKDGVWGNNGRSVDSVATITCRDHYYPSGRGKIQGQIPDSRTLTSTCRIGQDGWGYWDNGKLDCFLGNAHIIRFG